MRTSTTSKNAFALEVIPSQKKSSEVKFTERNSAIQKNNEVRKKILPFVTTYHPALPNHKKHLHEQMAFSSKVTTTEKNIQRVSHHFLQESKISGRYSRL